MKYTRSACDPSNDHCREGQPRSTIFSNHRDNDSGIHSDLLEIQMDSSVDLSLDVNNISDCMDVLSKVADRRTEKKKECPTRANIPLSKHPYKFAQHKKGRRRCKHKHYCKMSRRRHRVKRIRPSHCSKAPVKHFTSSMCTTTYMTSGKLHGQALVNQGIHVHVRGDMPYYDM